MEPAALAALVVEVTRHRSDKSIVLAAVRRYGNVLEFAHPRLRADREVVLEAARHSKHVAYGEHWASVLHSADAALRGDKEIVLAAVTANSRELEYASAELLSDRDVVLAALERGANLPRGSALASDKALVLFAIQNCGAAVNLGLASPDLRRDPEVVMAAVRREGAALGYAHVSLQDNDGIVCAAMSNDAKGAYAYASPRLRAELKEMHDAAMSSLGDELAKA